MGASRAHFLHHPAKAGLRRRSRCRRHDDPYSLFGGGAGGGALFAAGGGGTGAVEADGGGDGGGGEALEAGGGGIGDTAAGGGGLALRDAARSARISLMNALQGGDSSVRCAVRHFIEPCLSTPAQSACKSGPHDACIAALLAFGDGPPEPGGGIGSPIGGGPGGGGGAICGGGGGGPPGGAIAAMRRWSRAAARLAAHPGDSARRWACRHCTILPPPRSMPEQNR